MEKVLPLTQEQNNKRLLFIGMCVDANVSFNNPTRFGTNVPMTIQDLTSSSTKTLEDIYVSIQKQLNESNLGLKPKETLKIGGVSAEDWLDFIKLTVQNREYHTYIRFLEKRKKELLAELETMKSPSQKKKDLLAELEFYK